MDCGERESFEQQIYGHTHYSETALISGETEEADDYVDYDTSDSEQTDSDDTKCCKCKSENIKGGLSDDEKIDLIVKHTDKDGKWHKEELPESDQKKEIFEEHIARKV